MLKKKNIGRDSKLDAYDLQDLLVFTMLDAKIDSVEMQGLKDIERYKYYNMTDEAIKAYEDFMAGVQGKTGAKGLRIDFIQTIHNILEANSKQGFDKLIYRRQMTYLLYELVFDGYVSKQRLDVLKEMNRYKAYFSSSALKIFNEFASAYNKRIIHLFPQETPPSSPSRNTQSTKVHDLSPNSYAQCGYCYGSGNVTCQSCNGMGGRYETRIDYDWDGSPIYREEFIPCMCNGGYTTCGTCGGSGSVYR